MISPSPNKKYFIVRTALLKTDSITFDSTGDFIVTSVSNDASVSDDEASNSSHKDDHDDTYANYDEIDKISESWD